MAQLKSQEINFFNKFRDDAYDVFTERSYYRLLKAFKTLLRPNQDKIILDLTCGSGAFLKYLREFNIPLLGMDLCFNLVAIAKKKLSYVKFLVGDIEDIPLPDESVDLVIFSGSLHHLPNTEKAALEAYRVLKKDGRCFAYDPNNRNPIMWLYRNRRSPLYSDKGITPNEQPLTIEEIIAVFSKAGFKVDVFAISGLSYRYIEDKKMAILLPIYNAIDRLLAFLPLSNRYGSFLITLARKSDR